MVFIKRIVSFLLTLSALALVGCSEDSNETTPVEQDSTTMISSESKRVSLKSEAVNEIKTKYILESGKKTAEFFREYFGSEMEIQPYEFEEEQEINYMYPSIFTVSADAANDTVRQITFFEVNEEDVRTILKIANFSKESVIDEALAFKGELKEPNFGDNYSTEYDNDLGLGVSLLIKGSMWDGSNEKPYSLTLFYDEKAYDKYVD